MTAFQARQAEEILNRQSGWRALTGTTDFRLITEHASSTSDASDPNKLAFDMFVDRIMGYIGSYHLKLGGQIDALVFSGGVGEKSNILRQVIGTKVECLGYVGIDPERNQSPGEGIVVDIGKRDGDTETSRKILVCRTDEQVRPVQYSCNNNE